jgi:6,7-dimethyl-8-ribityllumazine synthase
MNTFEGNLIGTGLRIGIAAARFNDAVVSRLVAGAHDALVRHGVADADIDLAWVPGAYELPQVAHRLAVSGRYDAVVCLGVVIRGATAHFDYIAGPTAQGIAAVSRETGVPVTFGVLTTDSIEQAIERAGTKAGNKGADAGVAAIEMASLLQALDNGLSAT